MARQKIGWGSRFVAMFVEQSSDPAPTADTEAALAALRAQTQSLTADLAEDTPAPRPPEVAAEQPAASASAVGAALIAEDQPLSDFYSAVPPSPKSAEEILAFLSGLKGMPESVQNQALRAMDAADTTWTIDDVLLDAHNKVRALRNAKEHVAEQVRQTEATARADLEAQDAYAEHASSTIRDNVAALREQIAEMESLLASEIAAAEDRKASAEVSLQQARDAADRKCARFDTEIRRLHTLIQAFGPPAPPNGVPT